VRVAGHPPDGFGGDLVAVVQGAGPELLLEEVEVDAEDDLGPAAAVFGQGVGVQRELAHLDQGIGAALPRRPVIAGGRVRRVRSPPGRRRRRRR
jgi:hypothetical protein